MIKYCYLVLLGVLNQTLAVGAVEQPPPNIVVIYLDDLGYGDTGPYGAASGARTPEIDRLANEGAVFTSFYAAPVCTPSRAQLLSGCYDWRVGMSQVHRPGEQHGFHDDETLLPELLRAEGYTTHMVGKWHLGDQPGALPPDHGFDTWIGVPYSNDMWEQRDHPPLPLIRDDRVVERIATAEQQRALTWRFTEEAVRIIENADAASPFFLYLPHIAVHRPIYPGREFAGRTGAGEYVDWIEEVDWSVGRILDAIDQAGIDDRTLVLLASDNGSIQLSHNSNLPLRGRKAQVWEGGVRVPFIARWPGLIPAGQRIDEIVGTIDLLPTLTRLGGGEVPTDRIIDGIDIWPLMAEYAEGFGHDYYYLGSARPSAVRSGPWKLHLQSGELYNLEQDISETTDVADENPEEATRLRETAENFIENLETTRRPAGHYGDGQPIIDENGNVRPDLSLLRQNFPPDNDGDADGLPDTWEAFSYLNPLAFDPYDVPHGRARSILLSYAMDIDPLSGAQSLETWVEADGAGSWFTILFRHRLPEDSVLIGVETNDDLSPNWDPLDDTAVRKITDHDVDGDGSARLEEVRIPFSENGETAFFRLNATLPE